MDSRTFLALAAFFTSSLCLTVENNATNPCFFELAPFLDIRCSSTDNIGTFVDNLIEVINLGTCRKSSLNVLLCLPEPR